MANAVSSIDVPLSIFGSWDTELSPPDIPEGASPANNDVVYLPGSVATRPGLNRVFAAPVGSIGPFSYQKSFVTNSGVIKNLYLTQGDGQLWVEDVTNSPGTATLLFASAGATYASSVTAFGSEFIALSDGKHGADIPLQYDGTNLWRLTQDGPGAAPTVTSIALPSVSMATTGGGVAQTIVSARTSGLNLGHFYTTIVFTMAGGSTIPSINAQVTVAGNTQGSFNDVFVVISTTAATFTVSFYSATLLTGTGGTATATGGITLQRQNNTVTGSTATAHQLQVGYQVQIQNAGTTVVGGTISSIVLNNEDNPGIATVTTIAAHGLQPNNQVNIAGVTGVTVGTAISNVAFAGAYVTITTSAAHGLSVGSEIIVAAVTATAVNGQWIVAEVPSTTTFTYAFNGAITAPSGTNVVQGYSAVDTGTVKYLWPLANVNPSQNFFTVQTAPSSTTFTISLSYTDGTWSGGTVSFQWDGIFFVTAVPSGTMFQYQQYGPNATSTTAGKVTPYGQATPGIHQCRVSFLLASGEITAPGPQTTFVANGGQYLSVTNLPLGPSNVIGRVLQFTGAGGVYFFYIPVPAQVNGLTVSTATQVNDNTTISIVLDFSDNTLYAATGVSIPGNNLAAQAVLGPAAGMFSYGGRLLSWGERNKVNNFVNMGFDGGILFGAPNSPLGWTLDDTQGTLVNPRTVGTAWRMTIGTPNTHQGRITQGAYLDTYGAPILQGNTTYTVRVWAQASVLDANLFLYIGIQGNSSIFTTFALFSSIPTTGQYIEHTFNVATPTAIPTDMTMFAYAQSANVGEWIEITELELIEAEQPYLNNISRISYAENPGAFDGLTGVIGPADDLSPIMNFGVIRQVLYIVTGSGLHETADNQQTEPSGWTVDQVADNCGAFSIASVSRNPQGIGSAFKDSLIWNGPDGAQIFSGQKPWKLSQEIQSVWDTLSLPSNSVNAYKCWTKNDETNKRCYFGIPAMGVPAQVLVLDYRNIDGAALPENPPVHISFTGKMIVSDLTRKWTTWTIPAASGELIYRSPGAQPQMSFGAGTSGGNVYILNPLALHDDDFGVIPWSYTTYFFVSHEQEQAFQVGSHRHDYKMAAAFIAGVGTWTLTPYAASLSNPFPASPAFPLSTDPLFDMDFGINITTTRAAFKVSGAPIFPSLDSYAKLQKLVINVAPAAWTPTRGSSGGAF